MEPLVNLGLMASALAVGGGIAMFKNSSDVGRLGGTLFGALIATCGLVGCVLCFSFFAKM